MPNSDNPRNAVLALPPDSQSFTALAWEEISRYYDSLDAMQVDAGSLEGWLAEWTRLHALVDETYNALHIASSCDTDNAEKEKRYQDFVNAIHLPAQAREQNLNRRLVDSGLAPAGFEVPLRKIRADIEIFREENLPLKAREHELKTRYNKITGAQTVVWEGQEKTLAQLNPVLQDAERGRREAAWRATMDRWQADRAAINTLWTEFLGVRRTMAGNAGFEGFRDYAWKLLGRFDYTPQDCRSFHAAIEEVVVPAARRVYERRRRALGLETLKPWDLDVDDSGRPPLVPFKSGAELDAKTQAVFDGLDPELAGYYRTMSAEGLLDLENRRGKAPGGFCTGLDVRRRPFIFMNAVGVHNDVQTLLHEAGHAFHAFSIYRLPYFQQWGAPMEFCEVASMSMELLAAPRLAVEGGFYDAAGAARARVEHLEEMLCFWPYMAVVDAFQHWVYDNPDAALDAGACDSAWGSLWDRFMPGVDWTGLDDVKVTGWHRKLHIHLYPFYYVEYGLAQLGAAQVWARSLSDPAGALEGYRRALAKGAATLPDLFATAGVRFAFDAGTLGAAVAKIEKIIERLRGEI